MGTEMTAPKNESAQSKPPEMPIGTSRVWSLLRENFAIVSGLAVVTGITLAIIFLFSYLSIFDWHLIIFVQYADVITFGIIAAGVVSGSFMIVYNTAQYFVYLPQESKRFRRLRWLTDGGVALAVLVFLLWSSIRVGSGYFHIVDGVLLLARVVFIVRRALKHIRAKERPTLSQVASYGVLVFLMTALCGRWLGDTVLEMPEFSQNVRVKNSTIDSVKVVIVMSRFTVLLKNKMLYVVPTSDITEFQTTRPLIMIESNP
jgi:hypothetical protein